MSQNLVQFLSDRFAAARTANPELSARDFAKLIGVSSGAFSEIMSGRRALSRRIATRILPKLKLTIEDAIRFQDALQEDLSQARHYSRPEVFALLTTPLLAEVLALLRKSALTGEELRLRLGPDVSNGSLRVALAPLLETRLILLIDSDYFAANPRLEMNLESSPTLAAS